MQTINIGTYCLRYDINEKKARYEIKRGIIRDGWKKQIIGGKTVLTRDY